MATKRITEATIRDLDQKVQMESYIREKKEAILEDRKNGLKEEQEEPHIPSERKGWETF